MCTCVMNRHEQMSFSIVLICSLLLCLQRKNNLQAAPVDLLKAEVAFVGVVMKVSVLTTVI